jgi:hypothetical protein
LSDSLDLTGARWQTLRKEIESLREFLVEQGSIVRKWRSGKAYAYLRFYATGPSGRTQRSLYIGDDGFVKRVEALLEEMRAPKEFLRETLQLAKLACCVARPLLRGSKASGTE